VSGAGEPLDDGPEPRGGEGVDWGALYRGLEPDPLADAAGDADPRTARVVAWMRAAWEELEVPPARAPRALRRRAAPRRLLLLGALAAAALAVLGAALWRAGPRPLPAHVAQGPVPRAPAEPSAPAPFTAGVVALPDDRIELRSGPVRLVLLAPPPELEPGLEPVPEPGRLNEGTRPR